MVLLVHLYLLAPIAIFSNLYHYYIQHALCRVVYAMSRDKDVRTCLKNVLAVVPSSHVHFVQVKLLFLFSLSLQRQFDSYKY